MSRWSGRARSAPDRSVRGWKTAADAQVRVVAALARVTADPRTGDGDVLIVAHGGVGTLLLGHLLGVAVTRTLDQPRQGCGFAFDRDTGAVIHGWVPF